MASFQLLDDFSWTRWEPLLGSCPSQFHTRSDPHHRHTLAGTEKTLYRWLEQDQSFWNWHFACGCSITSALKKKLFIIQPLSSLSPHQLRLSWCKNVWRQLVAIVNSFLLANVEDDFRRECWTKENRLQRFCGFVRVQKVITLHAWVGTLRVFTSPSF